MGRLITTDITILELRNLLDGLIQEGYGDKRAFYKEDNFAYKPWYNEEEDYLDLNDTEGW